MKRQLFSTAQTREIDRSAIARDERAGYGLMLRAGQRAFDHIQRRYPALEPAVIIAGPGNNGGDGYVVGRHLLEIGIDVVVVQVGEPGTDSCRQAHKDYITRNGPVTDGHHVVDKAGVVIDGLLGSWDCSRPGGGLCVVD